MFSDHSRYNWLTISLHWGKKPITKSPFNLAKNEYFSSTLRLDYACIAFWDMILRQSIIVHANKSRNTCRSKLCNSWNQIFPKFPSTLQTFFEHLPWKLRYIWTFKFEFLLVLSRTKKCSTWEFNVESFLVTTGSEGQFSLIDQWLIVFSNRQK